MGNIDVTKIKSGRNIKEEDMIGLKFNRLTIIGVERRGKENRKFLKCICDCQQNLPPEKVKYTYATKNALIRGVNGFTKGTIKSCGCLKNELSAARGKDNKITNKYDLTSKEYGIGRTQKGYEFYFDKEDYEIISKYCWHKHQAGYLRTCMGSHKDENNKWHNSYIMMHQLIGQINNMYYPLDEELDHVNGLTYDNRKCNLRVVNHMTNMKNTKIKSNNTSGHKGVSFNKLENRWISYITNNKKRIHLGTFESYDDAVKAREDAELIYFGKHNRDKEYLYNAI